jgi:hypothetical protein
MRGQLPLRTLIDRCPSPLLPTRFAALLCALPSWAACSCASASVPTRYIWAHGEVSVGARMWPDVCMRGGGVALPLPSEGEAGVQDRLGDSEQESVGNNE